MREKASICMRESCQIGNGEMRCEARVRPILIGNFLNLDRSETEPLSSSADYQESGMRSPRTEPHAITDQTSEIRSFRGARYLPVIGCKPG